MKQQDLRSWFKASGLEQIMRANSLVDFWAEFSSKAAPFVHPKDTTIDTRKNSVHEKFDDYINQFNVRSFVDASSEFSLLPQPYSGDLDRADIFVTLLNPGLAFTDYYAELSVPGFKKRLESNLRQSFEPSIEFPFMWLDPSLCWHCGFRWWERKLRAVLQEIASDYFKGNYREALKSLSNRLACIELYPYHSYRFAGGGKMHDLPSVNAAQEYFSEFLAPQTKKGNKTVIVTRGVSSWGNPTPNQHLLVYGGGQARAAGLGPSTRGGKAILARYLADLR